MIGSHPKGLSLHEAPRSAFGSAAEPCPAAGRSKTIAANRSNTLTRLFVDADTNANIRGTRWAGYQAITEYLDHSAPVYGKTLADKAVNRALRSIDGSTADTKEKAFSLLSI